MNTVAVVPHELVTVLTEAGIDPTLGGPGRQEALHQAIAGRRGSCSWTRIHTGWVVTLHYPEQRTFFGTSLDEGLGWCLVWLMTREHAARPRPFERPGLR
jgi:hypothetical protein